MLIRQRRLKSGRFSSLDLINNNEKGLPLVESLFVIIICFGLLIPAL